MPLLPPDVQAEQLREYQRQAFPKMSTLELGEMTISGEFGLLDPRRLGTSSAAARTHTPLPESCLANVADLHEERSWQDLAPLCRQGECHLLAESQGIEAGQ